jgi:hypothetical protein
MLVANAKQDCSDALFGSIIWIPRGPFRGAARRSGHWTA